MANAFMSTVVAIWLCAVLLWAWTARRAVSIPLATSKWPFVGMLQSAMKGDKILLEIYQKQLIDDQPYKLPGVFGDSVMLPPSMIPWLLKQPESELSAKWAQLDALNIPTTFLRAEIGVNPVHEPLVRRQLTAHLDAVEADMWDEVGKALEDLWGDDTKNWRDVALDGTMRTIVARASNRIFLGQELCRNAEFIESAIRYVTSVSSYGLLLSFLPQRILRPLAGVLARLPIAAAYARCAHHLQPFFEKLVTSNQIKKDQQLPQHLFATWLVTSAAERFPESSPENTPDFLSRRIMALNFAAVHTSTLTASNLILDVFSGDPAVSDTLRDEALATSAAWSHTGCCRARFNSMVRLDSAMRESMRLWGVAPRVLRRRVMKAGGVTLPDCSGRTLVEGTTVCISGWGLHHDQKLYPQPFTYLHDRFVKKKSANVEGNGEQHLASVAAAVETGDSFTAWGIGKHACPGRYFAVDFVKIIMAQVLENYEVEMLAERPRNWWIEYNVAPPPGKVISVRRRLYKE